VIFYNWYFEPFFLEQLGLKYIVKRKEENQVKKRILSMLLVLCMLLGMLPTTVLAANSKNPFTDVRKSDWFYNEVQYVYENGLMEGTASNTFSPKVTTSRGMLVTILWRLEGQPTVSGTAFTDVASGQWYTDAVQWASANSIVEGYGNGKFGPNNTLTREQMATILYRYAAYKGYDVTASADLSKFTDAGKISSYAATAMSWANATGLITGMTDTTLAPQGSAIRAQAATILMRFCENVVSTDSPNVLAHAAYEKILAEYRDYFSIPIKTVAGNTNDYISKYPDIDFDVWNYFYGRAYGGSLVYARGGYAYYDVDGNGVDELVITDIDVTEYTPNRGAVTVYAWNGTQATILIGGIVAKESLSLNTDGTIDMFSYYYPHEITSYQIDSTGYGLTQIRYLRDLSEEEMNANIKTEVSLQWHALTAAVKAR
jgi:hypothetical protein